jgi:malate dehydrogenase (oxaloacetate-decarboxylating)
MPEEAKAAGAFIVATGRSDYPNQINNSLVFPGLFKSMLEKNIPQFKTEMFIKAADALAKHVKDPTADHIIPTMFEKGVVQAVYDSVS